MSEGFHTLVLILHVLGAAVILGVALVSLIVQLKKPPVADNLKLLGQIWKKAHFAFGLEVLTGMYLAASEADEFIKNPLLWVKLGLIVVALAISAKVSWRNEEKGQSGEPDPKIAWVVLLIYAAIISIGVLFVEG